jgi:hypothetical protein
MQPAKYMQILGSPRCVQLCGVAYGACIALPDRPDRPLSACLAIGWSATLYGAAAAIVGGLLGELSPIVPIVLAWAALRHTH